MSAPMILFTLATLLPILLIGAAGLWGGVWVVAALVYMTAMTAALDVTVKRITPPAPESEFPVANRLSVVLALGHFALLAATVAALSGERTGVLAKLGTFVAAGQYFGQVSNANAHELIHRGSRGLHTLGKWVYISLLFGHHTSAHVLVHHRLVATRDDPSSARRGESLYRFARRAWLGSFRAGYAAETRRLAQIGRAKWRHPYVVYCGGAVLMMAIALWIGGAIGLFAYIGLAGFATFQLLMSDYVQHYGLTRRTLATGKPEPVAARHSWNSPHWFSSALMLNAPRHSDHHAHPSRPYAVLRLSDGPLLPRSLPVMAGVALFPRRWRRIMDPLVAKWQAAD